MTIALSTQRGLQDLLLFVAVHGHQKRERLVSDDSPRLLDFFWPRLMRRNLALPLGRMATG